MSDYNPELYMTHLCQCCWVGACSG